MPSPSHLTTGQVAEIFGAPEWRVRRIVDSLPPDVEIQRAGLYRLIPRSALPAIGIALEIRRPPSPAAEGVQ